jgi:PD-(D/E)XK endonuclease
MVVALRELTTNQKGLIAETAITYETAKLGLGVARPLDDEKYDLILDLGVRLLRVQCKWAVRHGDVVVIRCRTSRRGREGHIHRGYRPGEIDPIAAHCAELDRCYLLPTAMSVGRAAVQLRLAPTRNNQRARVHWARDFELDARLMLSWAHSSAGRAPAWHAGGRRFEPAWVHLGAVQASCIIA